MIALKQDFDIPIIAHFKDNFEILNLIIFMEIKLRWGKLCSYYHWAVLSYLNSIRHETLYNTSQRSTIERTTGDNKASPSILTLFEDIEENNHLKQIMEKKKLKKGFKALSQYIGNSWTIESYNVNPIFRKSFVEAEVQWHLQALLGTLLGFDLTNCKIMVKIMFL